MEAKQVSPRNPLVLEDQGTFFVGGDVIKSENGDTTHVNHSFIEYQIPVAPRKYPLVMWHGGGQTGKTWETTPDGRDGYQQIFARRGYPVYIIDQAGRGRGGRLTMGTTIGDPVPSDSNYWNIFRLGEWSPPGERSFFPGVQFPRGDKAVRQYLEQTAVSTGPEPQTKEVRDLQAGNIAKLFDQIGAGVLITHSNSGQYGWWTAMKRPNLVKAVVAYEPGSFSFPEDSVPPEVKTDNAQVKGLAAPQLVPSSEFNKLTKMPIVLIYGDNIDFDTPSDIFGVELWRINTKRAKQFVKEINKRGGNAQLIFLPKIGIKGNTHFPFSDLNNVEVADQLSDWLKQHNLAQR